ncbi:PREDICTED: uncharacterized protein DDB_G0292642-like, partial [Cyprinodon variegatus]|uniref:uncharacterized protein DDB_G0292642-like n=1 Tax=Cyprinodon variegatus TaxID=28743 RepID=UPI000742629E
ASTKCPALKDGTLCGALWSYQEVRRLAVLTAAEMQHFEENTARLAAAEYCSVQQCPGCKTYVERADLTDLCVECLVCAEDNDDGFQFCWQCLMPWKGPAPRSDRCDNDGCINRDLELLRTCKDTTLPEVEGVDACPTIRACPTCGQRVEHDKTGCKNIICPRCQVEFCFVCLKLTPECLETSTHFIPCSDGGSEAPWAPDPQTRAPARPRPAGARGEAPRNEPPGHPPGHPPPDPELHQCNGENRCQPAEGEQDGGKGSALMET